MKQLFHDDDCGELLNASGVCPRCGFPPDMQSLGIKEVPTPSGVKERCRQEAERKRAEEAARHERDPYTKEEKAFVRRLRRVLATKPDGIALLADINGGISVRRRR